MNEGDGGAVRSMCGDALAVLPMGDWRTYWTRSLGNPPLAYGERSRLKKGEVWRLMEPSRTKLAAALAKGLKRLPLGSGKNVLYLGGGTGTTVSHIADLVGPSGTVYALEKSPRAFARLLATAKRWPNIAPLLRDVRFPQEYSGLVPMVDVIYMDVPQVDQIDIALKNSIGFLEKEGQLLLCLKLSSLGRERTSKEHVEESLSLLSSRFSIEETVSLEPYYKRHAFISASLEK